MLLIGPRVHYDRAQFLMKDPKTGLTKRARKNDRIVDWKVLGEIRNSKGTSVSYPADEPNSLAEALDARCGGSISAVERVCKAIERARRRCLELSEETTRWL